MIKAIFFDLDGVLYTGGYKNFVAAYEAEFNIPNGEFYKIIHEHPAWQEFTLGNISEKDFFQICEQRSGQYTFDSKRCIELLKESTIINTALINYIKNKLFPKYIIGIISNNPKEWYKRFVGDTGIKDIIKVHTVSSHEHIRKPDAAIFQIALDRAGIKGEEAIYVDDRPERTDGAKEVGMNVIIFDGNLNNFKKVIAQYERSKN